MKIAFITPTKDRPEDIRRMLRSFEMQTRKPDQVIIIDAGIRPVSWVVDEFPDFKIDYLRWQQKPSAAAQRNGGIELLKDDIDLVCFFDDDQALYPDAIENMLKFWKNSKNSSTNLKPLGAAGFLVATWKDDRPTSLKKSRLSEILGLYTRKPGGVARSGWQSIYHGAVGKKNLEVEWMGGGAIVVERKVLEQCRFDEFFEGYSYLEDLDFSYSVSRKYRLVVVADARFEHYQAPCGRGSGFSFGRAEVRNRRYIVKKHGLSMKSYRLAMFIRWSMNILSGSFARAFGNIAETLHPSPKKGP